jgi:chromosome segregation ATPase
VYRTLSRPPTLDRPNVILTGRPPTGDAVMIKKLLLAGVIGVIAYSALKSTKAFHYAKHEVQAAAEWAESQIPTEKKVAQLRKDVKQLDRDIEKAQSALAAEIVDVERLNKDVKVMKDDVVGEEKKILAFGEKLKNSDARQISYGRFQVSTDEAKQLLANDVKRHTGRKTTLGSMEQTLNARERIKDALQKQVDGLRKNKQELAVAIDKLEAELKVLQYQQIESKYQVDDTRLTRIKDSLRDLQRDVDIQRQKLKMAPTIMEDGAPSTGLSVDDILAPLTKQTTPVTTPTNED